MIHFPTGFVVKKYVLNIFSIRENMAQKTAIIIGAGPAGLTAAYELLDKTNIRPIVFEETDVIGGISQTVNYKGNRIDIGGHRFFSKSDRVMQWWERLMPLQGFQSKDDKILGRSIPISKKENAPDPGKSDTVMLVRNRLSRIFYLRKFFDYPITLNINTILNLGFIRVFKIGFSYVRSRLLPIKNEKTLEDFFINRFGRELYQTFFKDYTEKVWGIPCDKLSKEWGAQRIKGLSLTKTVLHAVKSVLAIGKYSNNQMRQKNIETSLIDKFYYPKLGPGQLWETAALKIMEKGGEIHMQHKVIKIEKEGNQIVSVTIKNQITGAIEKKKSDYCFSTMPVKDLILSFEDSELIPENVKNVANGLVYRDFITVGLLLNKLKSKNETKIKTINDIVPDNWIYIQERDVKIGRLQIFNNWSPYMVQDDNNAWIGLEYFCQEGDEMWMMPDPDFIEFAIGELVKIEIIDKADVIDGVVIRMKKAYPAYFGTYNDFSIIEDYMNPIENLFLIGRNGMHRYNNMDHSMLTAMTAVENIISGRRDKRNIWQVNAEEEYHETKRR